MELKKGIVCKTLDYKDSSKILYLYTPLGNKSIIARGVKKLNSTSRFLSQVGTMIQYDHTRGDLPSLKDGELINDYPNVKMDLETYTFVAHILELLNGTIDEYSNHEKMFHFIERLMMMYDSGLDAEVLTFIFEMKLLYFLGYGINFKGCQLCDENIDLVYSISDGGLICRRHKKDVLEVFDEDIYDVLKYLYYIDIDHYKEIELSKNMRIMVRHIIDVTYEEFVSFKTKSRGILKQIKKY